MVKLLLFLVAMILSDFCFAVKQDKIPKTAFNSISKCTEDCEFIDIFRNGLNIFGYEDPDLSKKNYDSVTEKLKQEFKKRNNQNGFSFQLSGAIKDEILKNANITQKRKLFVQFVSPSLKTLVLSNSEIKSVRVGVNTGDGASLNTIGIGPIDSSLKPEKYRSNEHSRGIAHIGESDPGFKNFEKVIFNSGKPLFTEQELLSILKKINYLGETKVVSEIKTTRFSKSEIDIIKVKFKLKVESESSKYLKGMFDVEAYFLNTKDGLFNLVPFEAAFEQYFNPIEHLYYGEGNSYQFILLGTYNGFNPSRIIKIKKNGLPEVIEAKMGFVD